VLQFKDEEGKDMLLKRFIAEQRPQTDTAALDGDAGNAQNTDRPKAATKRIPQQLLSLAQQTTKDDPAISPRHHKKKEEVSPAQSSENEDVAENETRHKKPKSKSEHHHKSSKKSKSKGVSKKTRVQEEIIVIPPSNRASPLEQGEIKVESEMPQVIFFLHCSNANHLISNNLC